MWWPSIVIGIAMMIFGLVFLIRRHVLARSYASRRPSLPVDHPHYRATPAFTPSIFALLGVVAILSGAGGVLLGVFQG